MIRLFGSAPSGNCYKVRPLPTQLGIPFERRPIDAGTAYLPQDRLERARVQRQPGHIGIDR